VFLLRALLALTRTAKILCYIALGGFVVYFPLGYLGEAVIYPKWNWAPLVDRLAIKDSTFYLFVLAMLCAFLQGIDGFLSRRTGKDSRGDDAGPDAAPMDTPN